MNQAPPAGPPGFLAHLAVLSALFLYPALAMLWRYGYPLSDAGATLLLGGLVGLAVPCAALMTRLRTWLRSVLLGLALLAVCLLQANFLLEGTLIALPACMALAAVAVNRVLWLLPVLAALTFGAFLDAGLDRRVGELPVAPAHADPGLPPVIHIVMDSFIGPDGLAGDAGSLQLRNEMLDWLQADGFETFPRAYSRYTATVDSLSYAFNFRNGPHSKFTVEQVLRSGHEFAENLWFQRLRQAGYRLNVYQNEEMDFCPAAGAGIERCWSYHLPNLATVQDGIRQPAPRAWSLLHNMLGQSVLIHSLLRKHPWFASQGISVYEPQLFEIMLDDLGRHSDGHAYFAHVLLPHGPFTYDRECRLDYGSATWERYPITGGERQVDPQLQSVRRHRYNEQARCALHTLRGFMERLRELGVFERALILVHGDHGSYVTRYPIRHRFRGMLTADDLRAAYSTLFAVKLPGGRHVSHQQPLPLEVLMEIVAGRVAPPPPTPSAPALAQDVAGIDPARRHEYVYLLGTLPMHRLETELFGGRSAEAP